MRFEPSATAFPYLDAQGMSRLDPRVRIAMERHEVWDHGDPSHLHHALGRSAAYAVDVARARIIELLGADPTDGVFFTAGPTQSVELAVMNAAIHLAGSRTQIIATAYEHQPVERVLRRLEYFGLQVVRLPLDQHGCITARAIADAIDDNTFLVTIALAQKDTGLIQPIRDIGHLVRARGCLLHVDASQGLSSRSPALGTADVDLASLSGHGMHGPSGVGALYVDRRVLDMMPDDRAEWTTSDPVHVAGVVGLGAAARILQQEGAAESARLDALERRLCERLRHAAVEFTVVGSTPARVPGYLLMSVPALDALAAVRIRDRIGCSPGSLVATDLRIGIGRYDSEADIDAAADHIIRAVAESRERANESDGHSRTVVNCEGEIVTISSAGYTQFCAISNTGNFLADLGAHALDDIVRLGRPERISVVIPSYRSNHRLGATLVSLIEQEHVFATEILVFINEPADAAPADHAANDATESWLHALLENTLDVPERFASCDSVVRQALARAGDRVRLRCVRQTIQGGMPAVYQTILSSFVARVHSYADTVGGTRSQRLELLDELLERSFVLICDDDIVLLERDALASAHYHALAHDAVVLGQLRLRKPVDADSDEQCVHDLMDCFIDIKYDIGVNALGPRGLLLRHALEAGPVTLDDPFGDQLYFARIASTRDRYHVAGRTFIEAAEYPSNGRMWRDLLGHLRDDATPEASARAQDIFRNIIALARNKAHDGRYAITDMEALLDAICSRDVPEIVRMSENLRARALDDIIVHSDVDEPIARRARSNRAAWQDERRIAAWSRWATQLANLLREVDDAFSRAVGAVPGHRILDLASGVGDPALTLARAVAPSGLVVGSDISVAMLRAARERAQRQGVGNVRFRLADAHDLPFDDNVFDIVTCRFGIMFFASVEGALTEARRVLRPGGRIVLLSWGDPEQPYFRHARGAIETLRDTNPDPDALDTFAHAEVGSLSEALRASGFDDVTEYRPEIELVWPGTGVTLWDAFQQLDPSLTDLARRFPDAWHELGEQVVAAFESHRRGDELRMPGVVNLAVARNHGTKKVRS